MKLVKKEPVRQPDFELEPLTTKQIVGVWLGICALFGLAIGLLWLATV